MVRLGWCRAIGQLRGRSVFLGASLPTTDSRWLALSCAVIAGCAAKLPASTVGLDAVATPETAVRAADSATQDSAAETAAELAPHAADTADTAVGNTLTEPLHCPDCPTLTALPAVAVDAAGDATVVVGFPADSGSSIFMRIRLPKGLPQPPCLAAKVAPALLVPGYLLLAWPPAGAAPGGPTGWHAALHLRECHTGLTAAQVAGTPWHTVQPAALQAEFLTVAGLPAELTMTLTVRIHVSQGALALGAKDPLLAAAVLQAQAVWAAAHLQLVVALVESKLDTGPEFEFAADGQVLDSIFNQMGESPGLQRQGLPILLVPCARRNNAAVASSQLLGGWTTRIPGGLAPVGVADGGVVATGNCPSAKQADAQRLGWRLAHEIGHWLGLRHPLEADGSEDDLPDTDPEATNLMTFEAALLPKSALTVHQIAQVRRHPALGHNFGSP